MGATPTKSVGIQTSAIPARNDGPSEPSSDADSGKLQVRLARHGAAPHDLREGGQRRGRGGDQPHQGRAQMDDRSAPQGVSPLRGAPDACLLYTSDAADD